ncbi:ABC transporter permease [Arcobacter sp. 15-2]|uniref:ABC transporter permease n=1 Tax=Arcobacter sp. 15-2 TaxID=3374109 RepID=UPI00399CE015
MKKHIKNISNLMIKELKSLWYDKIMFTLIVYSFSIAIYIGATATSTEIKNASIAFVDEDRSTLSHRIISSFYKPQFNTPDIINSSQIDTNIDNGKYTFIVVIPSSFEKNILSKKSPDIQVNIDATRMTQAGIGSQYIQKIISQELQNFLLKTQETQSTNLEIITRFKYNPNLTSSWFGSINEVINNIIMLSILLSGASLIREREHGTIEHLLVMPLNAVEIMLSKILAVTLVVLLSVVFSLFFMVEGVLQIPIEGSIVLFLFTTFLLLFSTTAIGIFMGTIAKNMPQLGMIFILTILPLMMLSGSLTPFESMPDTIQHIMKLMPSSYFVDVSKAILFKGAELAIIWKELVAIFCIGVVFFLFALYMFRRSLSTQ